MDLHEIERQLASLHGSLNLRTTADRARTIGLLLLEAKSLLPHGQFLPWLRRQGIRARTAQTYAYVAKAKAPLQAHLTLDDLLAQLRAGRRALSREARHQPTDAPEDPDCRIVHSDCRKFIWPESCDVVATDPPWQDTDAYDWLDTFAAQKLRAGGLLLVQCGTGDLLDRLRRLHSLTYYWTLCIYYSQTSLRVRSPVANWRPVLVCYKAPKPKFPAFSDTYTVRPDAESKAHHQWQQPLNPWRHWVDRLTPPGALVFDPFAGSGTIGVACALTGRRYLGTEVEANHARTARARIEARG